MARKGQKSRTINFEQGRIESEGVECEAIKEKKKTEKNCRQHILVRIPSLVKNMLILTFKVLMKDIHEQARC